MGCDQSLKLGGRRERMLMMLLLLDARGGGTERRTWGLVIGHGWKGACLWMIGGVGGVGEEGRGLGVIKMAHQLAADEAILTEEPRGVCLVAAAFHADGVCIVILRNVSRIVPGRWPARLSAQVRVVMARVTDLSEEGILSI